MEANALRHSLARLPLADGEPIYTVDVSVKNRYVAAGFGLVRRLAVLQPSDFQSQNL